MESRMQSLGAWMHSILPARRPQLWHRELCHNFGRLLRFSSLSQHCIFWVTNCRTFHWETWGLGPNFIPRGGQPNTLYDHEGELMESSVSCVDFTLPPTLFSNLSWPSIVTPPEQFIRGSWHGLWRVAKWAPWLIEQLCRCCCPSIWSQMHTLKEPYNEPSNPCLTKTCQWQTWTLNMLPLAIRHLWAPFASVEAWSNWSTQRAQVALGGGDPPLEDFSRSSSAAGDNSAIPASLQCFSSSPLGPTLGSHMVWSKGFGNDDAFLLQQSMEEAANGFCTPPLRRAAQALNGVVRHDRTAWPFSKSSRPMVPGQCGRRDDLSERAL